MLDDDHRLPWPVADATPQPRVRAFADDELANMPGPGPPITIDFDRGRSPDHWPYWREPWLRGYKAHVDEGLALAISGSADGIGLTTLSLSLEPGTKVIYSWSTTVITMSSGTEQRISPFGSPRRRFEGTAFLLDAGSRDLRGTLMRAAAAGSTFLLALPFEELIITVDSPGLVITVEVAAFTDWMVPGQRAIIIAPDGTSVGVVVQSAGITTFTIARVDANGSITAATLGTAGRAGGRVMPIIPVLLDPQQGFARYPVSVDLWSIRAVAAGFGYAGSMRMGANSALMTFTDGLVDEQFVLDEDLLIWDRINSADDTAAEAMDGGNEIVDLGALPFGIGVRDTPDWARSLKYRSTSLTDWTWFKAFISQLRGRQGVFALSTNTPDFIYVSTVASGIKVQSASVAGSGDYVSWFASPAHRRLAITSTSGVVNYFEVFEVVDNLDGTLTLTLDVSIPGTPSKISLLEQVRFERDDIEVAWDGGEFEIDEVVRVCHDALEVPSRFMYDRIVTLNFAYTGIPPSVPPTTQTFSIPSGGHSYLINVTTDRTLGFGGVTLASGEAVDGMVVTIENNNTSASSVTCNHEDTGITPALRRFHNVGLVGSGGTGRSTTYRYHGATERWIQIL